MNNLLPAPATAPEDLFDAIGKTLEPAQREYFYQRMLYFRHLRPEDELLRIVEAMGLLALITREGPVKMAAQREQLAAIMESGLESMHSMQESSAAWHKQLDGRLSKLPAEIARGVNPATIAERIAESLRQQFVQSGVPQTADALAVAATAMNMTAGEFQRTTATLTSSYSSTVKQADSAIADITRSIRQATEQAERSIAAIRASFSFEYKLSLAVFTFAAIILGLILGYFMNDWMHPAPPPRDPAPATQVAPPSSPQHIRKKQSASTPRR